MSPDIKTDFVEDWQPSPQTINEKLAAYRGSWLDQMSERAPTAFEIETSLFLRLYVWKASSLMILGMALFKLGAFQARWSRRHYLSLVGAGWLIGIPMTTIGVVQNFSKNWALRYSFYLGAQYNYWGSYLIALGWIGLTMLWCKSPRAPALKERMAAVGRMAFSNYILQTVVCTTIFYGHGFGYFERVPRTGQILIVFAIYAAQLVIAPLWLHHFRFGPLEWLWRSLTYGKRHPFRWVVGASAQHPAIQKIQNLFREKSDRLYHWAEDRAVPADNNRAERELRPLVIARKISFGSQSEAGAHTREVLMSVLHTLRKRTRDVTRAFQQALDALAADKTIDLYKLLFRCDSS